jgi:hypothetical protein
MTRTRRAAVMAMMVGALITRSDDQCFRIENDSLPSPQGLPA